MADAERWDENEFLRRVRDPERKKPPLSLAEWAEMGIAKIKAMPEAQRKVKIAEFAALLLKAPGAESIGRLMADPEPLFAALRQKTPPTVCVDGCGGEGPVRRVLCARCGWSKVLCVSCADKKDSIYSIDMDDKLLMMHEIMAGHSTAAE